jgi:hypothetical protein
MTLSASWSLSEHIPTDSGDTFSSFVLPELHTQLEIITAEMRRNSTFFI